MQVHTLHLDDFSEDSYALIGIHTTLEDYKLAYLLNQRLKTKFFRAKKDLDYTNQKSKASFSVYNYTSTKYDSDWHLISNIFNQKQVVINSDLLFNSPTRVHLVPEKKTVDFFLKIMGETTPNFILNIIDKIKKIPQIITSYTIDTNKLKSKNSLIL